MSEPTAEKTPKTLVIMIRVEAESTCMDELQEAMELLRSLGSAEIISVGSPDLDPEKEWTAIRLLTEIVKGMTR